MSENNEKIIDGLPNPDLDGPINPLPEDEELPMEQQKKAVNVQDLVFVRQYIDKKMKDEVPVSVYEALHDNYYNKEETNDTFYQKTEIDENFYNKDETDNIFAKKTDVPDKAKDAEHADVADYADVAGYTENTTTVNGLELKRDDKGVLKIGDVIIPQKIELNFTATINDNRDGFVLNFEEDINDRDKIEFVVSIYDPGNQDDGTSDTDSIVATVRKRIRTSDYTMEMNSSSFYWPSAGFDNGLSEGASMRFYVLYCNSYDSQTQFDFSFRAYVNTSKQEMSVNSVDAGSYVIEKIYKVIE